MKKRFQFLLLYTLFIGIINNLDAQTVSTLVNLPQSNVGDGLIISATGDLFLSSGFTNSTVYRITPGGEVSNFSTGLQGAVGAFFDSNGNLYANSYNGDFLYQISPSGVPSQFATGLNGPAGVVVSPTDEIFISEFGRNFSGTGRSIKKINSSGSVTTFATGGGLADVIGIAQDDSSNIYAANWASGVIYKITPDGTINWFINIGGSVNQITYSNGYLYVPSPSLRKIFKVNLDGEKQHIAGSGLSGSSDGLALEASFSRPNSIAASVTGDSLYIVDAAPGTIRLLDLTSITGVKEGSISLPSEFKLANYPNPFNPSTSIKYSLAESNFVSLKIFNVTGQHIATLVNNFQNARDYSVEFDASNLPSGVYLYQLTVGNNFERTNKMLLVQ